MSLELIDIGPNLAHESFRDDLPEVIQRAHAAGVAQMVVTGSDAASTRAAAELAQQYPGELFATAGLHPHHADSCDAKLLALFRELAARPEVVALGEMGLDFFRDFSPRAEQERAFHDQLQLAVELQRPVFLHQREAHNRFLPILKEYLDALPGAVAHCFTGGGEELDDYLKLDLHIGITGWICDERRGAHLLDIVDRIPANRLMIETDAPYLIPRNYLRPRRGAGAPAPAGDATAGGRNSPGEAPESAKTQWEWIPITSGERPRPKTRRNEPANLSHVLATVAAARGEAITTVAADSTATARRFFGLPSPQQPTDHP